MPLLSSLCCGQVTTCCRLSQSVSRVQHTTAPISCCTTCRPTPSLW